MTAGDRRRRAFVGDAGSAGAGFAGARLRAPERYASIVMNASTSSPVGAVVDIVFVATLALILPVSAVHVPSRTHAPGTTSADEHASIEYASIPVTGWAFSDFARTLEGGDGLTQAEPWWS